MVSAPHARRLFLAAGIVGIAHALPSLYWALGGTALVSTLGDWAARWQRESPIEVAVALSLIFLAKLAGATLPLLNHRGLLPVPRLWRGLFWCAAALLVTYGVVNVVAALAALTGLIDTSQARDTAGLVGHAFLWDPLFALWGLLLGAALWVSRPPSTSTRRRQASAGTPGPSRSLRPAARPEMARSSDSAGPLTSGPSPIDTSASVARNRTAAMRCLEPPRATEERAWYRRDLRSASAGYMCSIPSGRRMSSPWTTSSTSRLSSGAGGVDVRVAT